MIKINNKQQQSDHVFFPETPKMVQWTVKYSGGLVKNEKQANYVLIGFIAVIIIIAIIFIVSGSSNQPTPGTIPVNQFVP